MNLMLCCQVVAWTHVLCKETALGSVIWPCSKVGSVYCQQRDVILNWGDTGMRHNCSTVHVCVVKRYKLNKQHHSPYCQGLAIIINFLS